MDVSFTMHYCRRNYGKEKCIFNNGCLGINSCGNRACGFQFEETERAKITDISASLDFMKLSRQGFMGGSVLYNPSQLSSGQLAKGAALAVRLGQVSREQTAEGYVIFNNVQERAQYGSLVVIEIDETGMVFTKKLYNAEGKYIAEGKHTIAINEKIDINGDGLADIEYKKPERKRPGFENAVYLTFLSSQETLNTSMFSVLQEQYERSAYPSGIIGINPNGMFIYSKYEGESGVRAAVFGVQKGDFVVDGIAGKYQKICSGTSVGGARAVSDAELEDVAGGGRTKLYVYRR
jgi:hypothetical protein